MKRNIEKELSILGITNNIDKLKYITNLLIPHVSYTSKISDYN